MTQNRTTTRDWNEHVRSTCCALTREDFHPAGYQACPDGGRPEDHPWAALSRVACSGEFMGARCPWPDASNCPIHSR